MALEHLQEEGALEPNPRADNNVVVGEPRYVLGERGPGLIEGV